MPDNSLSNRIFGNLPPPRERQVVEREVQVPVPVAFMYDSETDAYWVGNFGITEHGVYIREDASEREWYDACRATDKVVVGKDWHKADMCRFGLEILGKSNADVAQVVGVSASSVESYASISRAAQDKEVRLAAPSMAHFRVVQKLGRAEQLRWLARSRAESWSRAQLKTEVDKSMGIVKTASPKSVRRALNEQKKQAKALSGKAAKLPYAERQEMILFLREMASELENQKGQV